MGYSKKYTIIPARNRRSSGSRNEVKKCVLYHGDNSYLGDLHFADIEEDMLLGIDFLAKNKAIIDLSRQEVRLGDQVIVAELVRDGVEYTTG